MFFEENLIFPSINGSHYRIPNVCVTKKGTFIAACNDRKGCVGDESKVQFLTMCRKPVNGDWEEVISLGERPGWVCFMGSLVYDEVRDCIMLFGQWDAERFDEFNDIPDEEIKKRDERIKQKAAKEGVTLGDFVMESFDDGLTWQERSVEFLPVKQLHSDGKYYDITAWTHGCGHGITLNKGKYKGRLLAPARTNIGRYKTRPELKEHCYNCAIYSDDNGITWQTSNCVQIGTGEGTLCENFDGSITYNSRSFFKEGPRLIATSYDGGETWCDFRKDEFLIEDLAPGPFGCGGCNGAIIRVDKADLKDNHLLPNGADGVTVFTNPHAYARENMAACISFDSSKTWDRVKVFYPGFAAYSSIEFNSFTQTFCVLYEYGERDEYSAGIAAVEFDLEWLLN